jgi:general secretion pathway protein G
VRRIVAMGSSGWQRSARGLTVVELSIALCIGGVLLAIGLPAYEQYRERVRIDQAKRDIIVMSAQIANHFHDNRSYPNNLGQVGLGGMLDPWGNAYGYLNLGDSGARGQARKDHSLVPINTDFDLYSMGRDGRSAPPLTARDSRDDIVRANNGAFVGLAADY